MNGLSRISNGNGNGGDADGSELDLPKIIRMLADIEKKLPKDYRRKRRRIMKWIGIAVIAGSLCTGLMVMAKRMIDDYIAEGGSGRHKLHAQASFRNAADCTGLQFDALQFQIEDDPQDIAELRDGQTIHLRGGYRYMVFVSARAMIQGSAPSAMVARFQCVRGPGFRAPIPATQVDFQVGNANRSELSNYFWMGSIDADPDGTDIRFICYQMGPNRGHEWYAQKPFLLVWRVAKLTTT